MRPKSESSKPAAAAAAAAAAEPQAVFAHTSLDAHRIALEALTRGDAIARRLPRGYGPLRAVACAPPSLACARRPAAEPGQAGRSSFGSAARLLDGHGDAASGHAATARHRLSSTR